MAITSVKFNQSIGKIFEKTLSGEGAISSKFSNFFNKEFDKAVNEPARFAASMLVTSIVSKDAVGCVLYTTQSFNNKKIPEDKRGAVASLDLINGLLMVGGQLLVGKIIDRKLTPQLFGKIYSGMFKNKDTGVEEALKGSGAKAKSRLYEDNIIKTVKATIKETITEKGEKVDAEAVKKALVSEIGKGSKRYKLFEAGFGLVVTALATTALVKRTLVPLISTPLSAWFKEKVIDNKNPKSKPVDVVETAVAESTTRLSHPYANKNSDRTAFSNVTAKQA